jgi:monoamine oxidase
MLDRRTFLTGAAALGAAPALGAVPKSGEVEVVIVGAGAAGIAAARQVAAAGRRFALVEASERIGGRCITDTRTFGVPFDRGAHWIHIPETNPVLRLGREGFQIDRAARALRMRLGRRDAREGELEDFLVAQVRARRAIIEAARGNADASCASVLPQDLRDWRETIEFVLGPYNYGKDLAQISVKDFARLDEREIDAVCRQGYGALLAKLAEKMPVTRAAPVKRIDWRGGVAVETDKGQFSARAVIITASTDVLASGGIAFQPELPAAFRDAFARLSLGSQDYVALEMSGNPLGLRSDEMIFAKATGRETAALLANASGTNLCLVQVGGSFGRALAAKGAAAMTAFAVDWLSGLYGSEIRAAVRRTAATNWAKEPYVRGAVSVAAPGALAARRTLMQGVGNRICFAGEAAHETQWGTVGGAWESGERAAAAALKQFAEPPARTSPSAAKSRSPRAEAKPHPAPKKTRPRRAPAVQPPPPERRTWPFFN